MLANWSRRISLFLSAAVFTLASRTAMAADEKFEDTEVRVIKNKFFTKRFRLELDLNAGGVMNQAFHNSYIINAGLGFHFTESIGLHAEYNYVLNQNKTECEILGSSDFEISPIIREVQNFFGGYLSYTPIYGKYQLSGGNVVYFDWFFAAGGGLAANWQREGGCGAKEAEITNQGSTPQVNIGTGQRYFLSKDLALIWNLKFMSFQPAAEGGQLLGSNSAQNVILTLGIGYFL
jgi:outer membrane beta-barrel protein